MRAKASSAGAHIFWNTDSIQGDDGKVRHFYLARSLSLMGTGPRTCLRHYLCPVASVNSSLTAFYHVSAPGFGFHSCKRNFLMSPS